MKIIRSGKKNQNLTFLYVKEEDIYYTNFRGEGWNGGNPQTPNFGIYLESKEVADQLESEGWVVTRKTRDDGTDVYAFKVKIYTNGGAVVKTIKGDTENVVLPENLGKLDESYIDEINFEVSKYFNKTYKTWINAAREVDVTIVESPLSSRFRGTILDAEDTNGILDIQSDELPF